MSSTQLLALYVVVGALVLGLVLFAVVVWRLRIPDDLKKVCIRSIGGLVTALCAAAIPFVILGGAVGFIVIALFVPLVDLIQHLT